MALDHDILTMKEVCDILQVHPPTIYKLVRAGEGVKPVGRHIELGQMKAGHRRHVFRPFRYFISWS